MADPNTIVMPDNTAGALIAASRVGGCTVYNMRGDHLGNVFDLMIDKKTGRVSYAIMSFGGFLGIGESFHPVPWAVLAYDRDKGGYLVDIDTEKLRQAPTLKAGDDPGWHRGYGQKVDDYYGVVPSAF